MVKIERHTPGHVSGKIKIKRVVWDITAAFLFRPFITPAFRKWRIALLRLFGAKVEWDANVYASAKIWAPWMLQMGHRACLLFLLPYQCMLGYQPTHLGARL